MSEEKGLVINISGDNVTVSLNTSAPNFGFIGMSDDDELGHDEGSEQHDMAGGRVARSTQRPKRPS